MKPIANVKVIGTGTPNDPFRVDLPTYVMDGNIAAGKVNILVPDDEVDENGNLDEKKIRRKYKNQKWDKAGVTQVI